MGSARACPLGTLGSLPYEGEKPEKSPLKHRVPGGGPFGPRVVSL